MTNAFNIINKLKIIQKKYKKLSLLLINTIGKTGKIVKIK